MTQTDTYQKLLHRYFPQNTFKLKQLLQKSEELQPEKKRSLADHYLLKGEKFLLQGNLEALPCFDVAVQLDTDNPDIWYRQGLAFFEYGAQKGKEKTLFLASKSFKEAIRLNPSFHEAFFSWGAVLLELGQIHKEHHFFLESKEKYLQMLKNEGSLESDILKDIYWHLGITWTHIAECSGEALDVRMAIQSFTKSLEHQNTPTEEFWNDFGSAYHQMGLLINDNRHYLEAARYFEKSIKSAKEFFQGYTSLAETYTQLYINTMDEAYFLKANESFSKAVEYNALDETLWLSWAQLLGESGKLDKNAKKLRLSVEKCVHAHGLSPNHPKIIGQWVESLSVLGAVSYRHDLLVEAENKIIKATDLYPADSDLWYAYAICMDSLAEYYEDHAFYDLGIEKAQQGLQIERTSPELWHLLASFHTKLGSLLEDDTLLKLASKFFKKAMDLKPVCPSLCFDYAYNVFRLGEILQDENLVQDAIYEFEQAIQLQKNSFMHHPENLFHYGCALQLFGEFIEDENYIFRSVEIFWQILLIEPDFPNIYLRIALSFSQLADYSADTNLYQKAFHYFKLASKQDEENENLWLEWGLSLINFAHHTYDFGSYDSLYLEAEQKIIKSGSLGNQHAYYHLACLYSLMEKLSPAMALLEQAQKLNVLPSIEELLEDEWLESLRETPSFTHFLSLLETKEQR